MLNHYVEYLFTGVPAYKLSIREIPDRDRKYVRLLDHCIGFRYFEVETDGTLKGARQNESGWHYQGKKLTLAHVKAIYGRDGKHKKLISSMEINGYKAVVRTKFNELIPLKDNDVVI